MTPERPWFLKPDPARPPMYEIWRGSRYVGSTTSTHTLLQAASQGCTLKKVTT